MIDGISIELSDFDFSIWETSPVLEFSVLTAVDSGQEIGSRKAHYKGLDFIIEPQGKAKIKGSIHKFFNNGEHNANRLTYENLLQAVSQLSEFGIIAEQAKIKSFEIGLNIDTSLVKIDTKTFLNSLLYCRGAERSDMEINGKMNFGYAYKTANVTYKVYDKAEQAKIQSELLRVETKFTRMRAVENYQIKTLADLTNPDKLSKLILDKYLKPIDEMIFFEWEQIKSTRRLPAKYKSKFKDLRNPDWWIKDERSRKERHKNKTLLEKLINQYAKRNIKNILKDLILLELQLFTRNKKGYEYTGFESLKNWNQKPVHAQKKGTNAQRIVCANPHERSEGKERKFCAVCGKEITHQKSNSKYCSDSRKCRDKAYNLKVSEKRKAQRTQKQKEILKLINEAGTNLKLLRTTNPKAKKKAGSPTRRTSIIVTVNGKKRLYNGQAARFFLKEFEKRMNPKPNEHETNGT